MIIEQGIKGHVTLVMSTLVLRETTKNLSLKAPTALVLFDQVVNNVPLELVDPTTDEVLQAAAYTASNSHFGFSLD